MKNVTVIATDPTHPKEEMEMCILCGKKTSVPRSLHIDFRDGYIEGAGQLCHDCRFIINTG